MSISLATEAGLAGHFPSRRFNQRERQLLKTVKVYVDAAPAPSTILLAMLAPGITPSHVVKLISTGVTGTSVTGIAIGDVCVKWIAASGLVDVKLAVATNTSPDSLLPADYLLVIRAAS